MRGSKMIDDNANLNTSRKETSFTTYSRFSESKKEFDVTIGKGGLISGSIVIVNGAVKKDIPIKNEFIRPSGPA